VTRHLLEIDELAAAEMREILDLAGQEKPAQVLAGRTVALLFEKPSARTRSSASVAVVQLGRRRLSGLAAAGAALVRSEFDWGRAVRRMEELFTQARQG